MGRTWVNNQRKWNSVWCITLHRKIIELICCARGFLNVTKSRLNIRICQHCGVKTNTVTPSFYYVFNISLSCNNSVRSFIGNLWRVLLLGSHLKKPGLDLLLKNYRPVSNLQYISKLTEKAVFQQMHSHMNTNSLYAEFQSSYRQHHSTEAALLTVMDILLNLNTQQVTLMVLLDLSAAFDTVNHDILLERLDKVIGMRGVTLEWFRSYLSDRCQQVCIDGSLSNQCHLNCGVPQGSCLGPLLFVT